MPRGTAPTVRDSHRAGAADQQQRLAAKISVGKHERRTTSCEVAAPTLRSIPRTTRIRPARSRSGRLVEKLTVEDCYGKQLPGLSAGIPFKSECLPSSPKRAFPNGGV